MKSAALTTNIIRQKISYCRMAYVKIYDKPTSLNDNDIIDLFENLHISKRHSEAMIARRMVMKERKRMPIAYIRAVLEGFERDPADTDFQRGYEAAFKEMLDVLGKIKTFFNDIR